MQQRQSCRTEHFNALLTRPYRRHTGVYGRPYRRNGNWAILMRKMIGPLPSAAGCAHLASKGVLASCAPAHTGVSADYQFSGTPNKCRREQAREAKGARPQPMPKVDTRKPCACGAIPAMQAYLARAVQCGRAVPFESTEPCACHPGTGESMVLNNTTTTTTLPCHQLVPSPATEAPAVPASSQYSRKHAASGSMHICWFGGV